MSNPTPDRTQWISVSEYLRDMNLCGGIATNMMTTLGLPWRDEVAVLCNFAGPFEETEKRWRDAARKAHVALDRLRWRVVADEPPTHDREVLVAYYSTYDQCWYQAVGRIYANGTCRSEAGHLLCPSHWMPLPSEPEFPVSPPAAGPTPGRAG